MTRALAALAALALFAVFAFVAWFWVSAPTARPDDGLAPSAPAAAAARPDGAERLRAVASGGGEAAVAARRSAPEAIAASDARSVPATAPVDPVRVLAVAGEDGRPLEGAVVRWVALTNLREWREKNPGHGLGLEGMLEGIGGSARTDEHGMANVPRGPERLRVTARHEERFTYAMITGEESAPVLLELLPDRTLAVQVVDAAGRPQGGVAVSVTVAQTRRDNDVWQGETRAEDGTAEMPHAQVRLADALVAGEVRARLRLPLPHDVDDPGAVTSVVFDDDPWPEEPLRLVMPPTGSVTVRLVDGDGRAFLQPARVSLGVFEDPDTITAQPRNNESFEADVVEGAARFEHVGLGLVLNARARPPSELRPVSERVSGPQHAREDVDVSLALDARWPVIVGRLVDEGGLPLAERSVEVLMTSGMPGQSASSRIQDTGTFTTGVDGRFRWAVTARRQGPEQTLTFDCPPTAEDGRRAGTLEIGRRLPSEDVDIGDVELSGAQLLVAGRVLDDAGDGVPGAHVVVQVTERDPNPRRGRNRVRWTRRPNLESSTDENGAFRIRGVPPPGELRLVATKRDWSDEGPVPFRLGAENVVLRLAQSGSIAGAVVVNEGIDPLLFQLRAVWAQIDPASVEPLRRNSGARVGADGTFEIRRIAPGAVDVELTVGVTGKRVAEFPGVFVTGGEVSRDPRLAAIDLTDVVYAHRIEVLDTARNPVDGGFVAAEEDGGRGRGRRMAFAIRSGVATVVAFERSVEMLVSAPGYRTAVLHGVDGDREVVLQPSLSVRLRLDDSVRLPRAPLTLRAKLVPRSAGRRASSVYQILDGGRQVGWSGAYMLGSEHAFGPSREITIEVPEPGPQHLVFELAQASDGRDRSMSVSAASGLRIDVGPDDAGKLFRVAPDVNAYEEAIKRLSD